MNKFQFGKMYLVKDWFWLLYPTKELVKRAAGPSGSGMRCAYRDAKWYSEEYNCNVAVIEPNTCFVLLERDNYFFKLLNSNGNVGWIYSSNFSECFELVKE